MRKITVVGCGFLGSLLIEELCKRAYAFEEIITFRFIDDGSFEARNCANQNVPLSRAEQEVAKVTWASELAGSYDFGSEPIYERLVSKNIDELIGPHDIIIDAVDNIPTRQLLWSYAVAHNVPMIHMGLSQEGTGCVEWTFGNGFDNFSLSPIALIHKTKKELEAMGTVEKLPPCELIAFRGCGLNLTIAAVKAIFIFFGFDPEGEILGDDNSQSTFLLSWFATNLGHSQGEIHEVEVL